MSTVSRDNLNKVYQSAEDALSGLSDGASVFVGGYAGHHLPGTLLEATLQSGTTRLTILCLDASGPEGNSLHQLLESGQVAKLVSPLPFDPRKGGPVKRLWETGILELEVVPTGILSERIRAGGAGLGGVFLPTGAGTRFAEGREVRVIDGREHVFQPALRADFALIRASVADSLGNLVYAGTSRNLSPIMAMSARVTVAEIDRICEPGGIDPETVITPAIFVQRIFAAG